MDSKTKNRDNPNVADRAFQDIVDRETASDFKEIASREEDATFNDIIDSNFDNKEKNRLSQLARREDAAPAWRTNLTGGANGNRGVGQMLLQRLGSKAAKRWGIGAAITAIMGLFGGGGLISMEMAHINDMWNGKAFRIMGKSHFTRMGEFRKTKYFTNPDSCQGGKVKCRFHQGISDNEINRLRQAGLNPDVATSSNGRSYITSLTFTEPDGRTIKVDGTNFSEHWRTSPRFVRALDSVASPMSVLTMGKNTLKYVVQKFRLNLHNPMGTDPPDEKTALRETRKTLFGQTNEGVRTGLGDDIDEQLREQAEVQRAAMEASNFDNPPSTLPIVNPDSLDLERGADIAKSMGGAMSKRMALGFVGGAATIPDSACTVFGFIRASAVLAKIYKHRALIGSVMLLLTISSKMKAGEANANEVGAVLNAAATPSVVEESKGKTFFQSEGWYLFSEGKVNDPNGLVRWATGGVLAGSLIKINQVANSLARSAGINLKRDCRAIKSTVGQALLLVTGVVISVATLGSGAVAGIATSIATSAAMAVAAIFIVPALISYMAGTISPDLTDPEGGYGIGNAAGAGMMAYQASVGQANGYRPMTVAEYTDANITAVAHQNFLAQANDDKNPFALNDPNSVPSKLLMALLPYSTSPSQGVQGGLLAALSPFSLFSSATAPSLLSSTAYAANDDPYGMAYCKDEDILAMGLATDAFCNILYWENDATLTDPKYSPDATTEWMLNNGHVDSNTGAARSQEFRNFMADCVIDETPILEDGGGSSFEQDTNSAGGTINTAQCRSTGERETYFRTYIQDTGLNDADTQGSNGTFGKEGSI